MQRNRTVNTTLWLTIAGAALLGCGKQNGTIYIDPAPKVTAAAIPKVSWSSKPSTTAVPPQKTVTPSSASATGSQNVALKDPAGIGPVASGSSDQSSGDTTNSSAQGMGNGGSGGSRNSRRGNQRGGGNAFGSGGQGQGPNDAGMDDDDGMPPPQPDMDNGGGPPGGPGGPGGPPGGPPDDDDIYF